MDREKRSLFLISLGLFLALVFGMLAAWATFRHEAGNAANNSTSLPASQNHPTIPSLANQFTPTTSIPDGALLAVTEATPDVTAIAGSLIGETAPDFTLKTLDNQEIRLSDLKGNPVLINF